MMDKTHDLIPHIADMAHHMRDTTYGLITYVADTRYMNNTWPYPSHGIIPHIADISHKAYNRYDW